MPALTWIHRPFLLAVIVATSASADQIPISLSTMGYFSSGTPDELTFQGIGGPLVAGFSGVTIDGKLALDKLGTFTLTKTAGSAVTFHVDDVFTLVVKFFDPTGVIGEAKFEATMKGHVNKNNGALFLDFGPPKTFEFSNATASGVFRTIIDDVSMELVKDGPAETSQILTGSIDNATDPPIQAAAIVPEPLSIVLLGTVILVWAGAVRRRLLQRQA